MQSTNHLHRSGYKLPRAVTLVLADRAAALEEAKRRHPASIARTLPADRAVTS